MIPNGEEWHWITVKKLPALFRWITSNHHSNFKCLNCFSSFTTENKRQSHKKVCANKDFCNIVMPTGDTKI